MVAEKQINEFISRLRDACENNLLSVTMYGSAADGEFHPEFSNVNLLCVLRESSFVAISAMARLPSGGPVRSITRLWC
jgi:hypothetical protein